MVQGIDLVIRTIATYGASWALGCAEVSRPVREALGKLPHTKWLMKLICCPACTGFHIGFWPALVTEGFPQALVMGFYSCGANFLIGRLSGVIK